MGYLLLLSIVSSILLYSGIAIGEYSATTVYSDSTCTTGIKTVYTTVINNGSCKEVPCVSGYTIKCFSSLPNQPSNSLRLGSWGNTICDPTSGVNQVIDILVKGTQGCAQQQYYTCDSVNYQAYICSEKTCSNCTNTTNSLQTCIEQDGASFSAICGAMSIYSLQTFYLFLFAVSLVIVI